MINDYVHREYKVSRTASKTRNAVLIGVLTLTGVVENTKIKINVIMYACMCVCMYVCMNDFMFVYTYMGTHTYIHTYVTNFRTDIFLFMYVCVCMYVFVYVRHLGLVERGTRIDTKTHRTYLAAYIPDSPATSTD